MPKFLSEESKRAWVAKVKATKAAKKRTTENEPIPMEETVYLPDDRPHAFDIIPNGQEDEGPGWLADIEVAIKTVKALA